METSVHRRLKELATEWLRERGCQAVAVEVMCPISRYRADVAGYLDTLPPAERVAPAPPVRPARPASPASRTRTSWRCPSRTVVVECKQSRGDFLRDRARQEMLLAERRDLESIRESLERLVMTREPDLRVETTTLFPSLDEWDFEASRRTTYRDLVRRLRRLDKRIHGETKFCMMARYRLADELYIAAPRGMLRSRELPAGWGLLEMAGDGVVEEKAAPRMRSREDFRVRWLRNIAVAACRR